MSLHGGIHACGTELFQTLGCCLEWQRGGATAGPQQGSRMPSSRMTWKSLGALPKTHLDDVLIVRLALHQGRNIQDEASYLNGDDLDGNGHSPACQDGSVDDLCVLQGDRGGRSSAACFSLGTCPSPTALAPGCCHSPDIHFLWGNGTCVQGPVSAQPRAPPQMIGYRSPSLLPRNILSPEPKLSSDISTFSWPVTVLWVGHQPSIPLCWLHPLPL